jgi:hypothetical protein
MTSFRVCAACNERVNCLDDECSCGICMGVVAPTTVGATLLDRLACLVLGHKVTTPLGGYLICDRCGKTADR